MFGRHHSFFFMLILSVLFLFGGCGQEATDEETTEETAEPTEAEAGGELQIAYSAQPPTLDPHLTTAVATSDMMRGVYETLVTADEDYNFQPMLAESYDVSDDGTVITFHLRENIKFHNGKEMTASDVVASMERWKELSSRADPFQDAVFEEEDEYTVVLTLEEPMSITFSVLTGMLGSFPAIMPEEVVNEADDTGVQEYIGTGPFKFEEFKQDSYVHLSKYDDYEPRSEEPSGLSGKKEALVDDVYFQIVTDPSTRVAGILSGEYDIIHAAPYDQVEMIEEDDQIEIHTVPGSTYVLIFNKKVGIFQDLEAREATRLALDLDMLMEGAFTNSDYYEINHNLVKPYLLNRFSSDVGKEENEAYDPDKAKEMLEDLGYTGEEVVIITTRDYDEQYQASVVLQQQLEQVGFNVELEVYDWPTLLEKTEDPEEYDLNIMGWGPQSEPTSYGFLRPGYDSGWADEQELADLIDDFRKQPSLDETEESYEAILAWMRDHIPLIKIGDSNRVAAVQSHVDNFQYHDGFIIWNVSVTK